jgi:hypothetical protein
MWARRARLEQQRLPEPFGLRLMRAAKMETSGCSRSINAHLSTPLSALQAVRIDQVQDFGMIGNGNSRQRFQ